MIIKSQDYKAFERMRKAYKTFIAIAIIMGICIFISFFLMDAGLVIGAILLIVAWVIEIIAFALGGVIECKYDGPTNDFNAYLSIKSYQQTTKNIKKHKKWLI